ncbi:CDP-diacylglycerol--glycerol-3-phosphate 3-phosphatidyltransferase [Propionibacteriaceae bacterium Y1923]|uniref:CDP-diacylglycerol--glycerol-3-phosphate 3-phosphatidyltransferase n=1 Tax=Aestuariimicrobium sp. Y1814 TaxID=3418742 RepID=UPI003C1B2868
MDEPSYDTDRVLTIPNLLSFARLVGVPLFVWLVLAPPQSLPGSDLIAVLVLALAGFTDWLDGFLARRWKQTSRVGQMLDPVADRLYILAIVVALAVRELVPWWLLVVLAARDLLLLGMVPLLKSRGYTSLPVHFIGKAATFCLLYAFPLVLLGDGDTTWHAVARVVGWASALWGSWLYWWAGVLYVRQTIALLRSHPRV